MTSSWHCDGVFGWLQNHATPKGKRAPGIPAAMFPGGWHWRHASNWNECPWSLTQTMACLPLSDVFVADLVVVVSVSQGSVQPAGGQVMIFAAA
ncbi:hypothetical protein BaRGS_00002855 [Batillaria attramentaria]|uniref:Uncharacterized protein n=1 Tax=Batillaria attramentaria TaxID=370345 RepID=A0ABD0M4D2_9CAEN